MGLGWQSLAPLCIGHRSYLRLVAECGHDRLLAFSGKHRGFCSLWGARRMPQTAALLVDHVIPRVPFELVPWNSP